MPKAFFYEKSEKSKKLGLILQNHLNKKINTEKEKAAKPNNSYYMLINSKCPGTIIECGFLSNPSWGGKSFKGGISEETGGNNMYRN
mgnify:CR=1 FL=1